MSKKEKTPNGRDPRDRKLACEKAVAEEEAVAECSNMTYWQICTELVQLRNAWEKVDDLVREYADEITEQSQEINELMTKLHNYEHPDNGIDTDRTLPIW